jgi:hypothetical protein
VKSEKMMKNLLATVLQLSLLVTAYAVSAQGPSSLFSDWENWQFNNTEQEYFTLTQEAGNTVFRVSGDQGWVQSARQYGDFILRGEVRFLEADSDSGIFLRVEPGTEFIRGWPGDAYQVQMREISVNASNNPLPLFNLYRHRVADGRTVYQRDRVFELYTGVGEWQQIEIILKDNFLTASLNGEIVLRATDIENASGYIGFQSEKGVIEYRNLEIHER